MIGNGNKMGWGKRTMSGARAGCWVQGGVWGIGEERGGRLMIEDWKIKHKRERWTSVDTKLRCERMSRGNICPFGFFFGMKTT